MRWQGQAAGENYVLNENRVIEESVLTNSA